MIQAARRWLVAPLLAVIGASWLQDARACTTTSTALIDLGSATSFDVTVPQANAGSGGSGLSCPGLLGLLSSQYIYLTVDNKSAGLVNSITGDVIPFDIATLPSGTPITPGATSGNLAGASLLSLGGVNGEVQLYVSLGAAPNVASGTYTGTIEVRWHYAVCGAIDAVGICVGSWTRSPGITQSCFLLLCTLQSSSLPGPGVPVDITVTLNITRDCRFDADDIDFGSAPFADSFEPVSGALGVTCTKGTTYTVGLSDGNYAAGGRRRMASGANRLEYDVFFPGGDRWDNTARRAEQMAPAQGNAPESFTYEARVYPDQTTPPPGVYQDTLIIDVAF
jgi:spore coat protein U-like protein